MLLRCAHRLGSSSPKLCVANMLEEFRRISTTPHPCAQRKSEPGDDSEGNPDGKPRKGKHEFISDEEIDQPPMIYNFAGVAPDHKAPCLSDEVKERIWRSYTDNPEPVTIERLAKEYRIRKQRVHAIVWLKDIEKQEEAVQGSALDDDIEEGFAKIYGSFQSADDERHVKIRRTGPMLKSVEGEDGEGPDWEEESAREDQMLLHEFERRMSFNKKQAGSMIQTDIISRRRPPGGWSYLVEELGEGGKRGKRGGRRFVAEPGGTHRGLNEIEKEFLKRESLIPRRRLTPR